MAAKIRKYIGTTGGYFNKGKEIGNINEQRVKGGLKANDYKTAGGVDHQVAFGIT